MPRLFSFRFAFVVLLLFSSLFGRPFDWQYSRLGIPFAVFYNPALLGNNPGYTIGVDAMHTDSANYDIRGAVVIPVSKVMKYGDQIRSGGVSKNFRYPNVSHMSSRTALSFGGMYAGAAGEEYYQLSAGIVTPISLVQSGVSLDFLYRDELPVISMNAGFSADVPRVVNGGLLHLTFHNLAASERDGTNNFGFTVGTSGIPFSDPRMFYMPYDVLFRFHLDSSGVNRVEGTACVNLDMSYLHTSAGTAGQTVAASLGYTFIRWRNGTLDHKFFASLGITLIGKSSSAAFLGSYGEGEEKGGAAFYSSHRRIGAADDDIQANLALGAAEGGELLFNISSSGSSVKSWVLRIDNLRGSSIKTFSGGNVVPSSIHWDGLASDGSAVTDDVIHVKLVLKGENRVVESNTVEIERR